MSVHHHKTHKKIEMYSVIWTVNEGSAPAADSELLTDLMHPSFSFRIAFGTHSVLIPAAGVENSFAPEAGPTGQLYLHPHCYSSC